MFNKLAEFSKKPPLYAPSTNQLWSEESIAQFILEQHLDPDTDGMSRTPAFMDKSVSWISSVAPPEKHCELLDLGCGPGLYAERFNRIGYSVTGIDISALSITYAKEQATLKKSNICYIEQDYLTMSYDCCFDVITLIFCDLAEFSWNDRAALLRKIHRALKPGGKFILDVPTPAYHHGLEEMRVWQYYPTGGVLSGEPHLHLHSLYRYDEDNTVLKQNIIIRKESVDCYNIWEHCFTKDGFLAEMRAAGFAEYELYGDIAGSVFDEKGEVMCAVLTK